MPLGEGWWLHTNGKTVEVLEHMNAVTSSPQTFGLTQAAVAKKDGEDEAAWRDRVLRLVMSKGWIRVRSHRGYTVFEYWKLNRRVADAIFEFTVDTLGSGPFASIQMNEVSTNKGFSVKVGQFYEEVEVFMGAGLGRRKKRCAMKDGAEKLYCLGRAVGQGR